MADLELYFGQNLMLTQAWFSKKGKILIQVSIDVGGFIILLMNLRYYLFIFDRNPFLIIVDVLVVREATSSLSCFACFAIE